MRLQSSLYSNDGAPVFPRYFAERPWSWVKSCCLPLKHPLASLGPYLTSRGKTHPHPLWQRSTLPVFEGTLHFRVV